MTVSELIAALQGMPQDAVVFRMVEGTRAVEVQTVMASHRTGDRALRATAVMIE